MKKSIQLDAMKRDDAKRKFKPNTGVTARTEKLIDYLYEITNIKFKFEEIRNFCNEYPESNFEDLKNKLKSDYRGILLERNVNEKENCSTEFKKPDSKNFQNSIKRKSKFSNENKKIKSDYIILKRINAVCNEIFGNFSENELELVKKINKKFPNLSQRELENMVKKYLAYKSKVQDEEATKSEEENSHEENIITKTDKIALAGNDENVVKIAFTEEVENHIDSFINKWILLCYSMSDGDENLEKYIKFLKLAAKKSLEYGTSVRCDWKNKLFIKNEEKPLNNAEKAALQIFQKTELPSEILKKIEEILNFEEPKMMNL